MRVDGTWHNAADYFKSVGLMSDKDKDDTTNFDLVEGNGRYFVAGCGARLISLAKQGRPKATPTPRTSASPVRTPTPARASSTPVR